MPSLFVKVCGLRRQEDLDAAARLGVALCGFIFHPNSPRAVTVNEVQALHSHGMQRVGVFVRQTSAEICAIMEQAKLDFAQLHGDQDEACAAAIGKERVIRVLWPQRYADKDSLQAAIMQASKHAFALLLDAGQQGGGSGQCLDATILAQLTFPCPWLLAGGLSATHLGALPMLLPHTCPTGLDFNSGLETAPGCKSEPLMQQAFAALTKLGLDKQGLKQAILQKQMLLQKTGA